MVIIAPVIGPEIDRTDGAHTVPTQREIHALDGYREDELAKT